MSVWKWVGAGIGGAGGFLVGGPAGAVAGAELGYGVGSAADASNESADAVDQANAAAAGVTAPNAGQFTAPTGYWNPGWVDPQLQANDAGTSQAQKDLADAQAAYNARAAETPTGSVRDDLELQALQDKVTQAQGRVDWYGAQARQLQTRDSTDQYRFASAAQMADQRQAPQIAQTQYDFSGAHPYELSNQADRSAQNALDAHLANDQSGHGQQALVYRLNSDLEGNQPSLAQAQLNQTTQQNIAAQNSMAASAGPMDYGAARRAAIMAGANTQQNAVGQAAVLRAQEYAQARGELGTVLGQQRGQTLQNEGLLSQNLMSQRGQDIQTLGQQYSNAIQSGQFANQQNQYNAGLKMQQQGINAGRESQFLNAYQTAQNQQNQYGYNYTQLGVNSNLDAQRIKAGLTGTAIQAQQADAASQRQLAGGMISSGSGFIGSGISSGLFSSGGGASAPSGSNTIGANGSYSGQPIYNPDGTLTGNY